MATGKVMGSVNVSNLVKRFQEQSEHSRGDVNCERIKSCDRIILQAARRRHPEIQEKLEQLFCARPGAPSENSKSSYGGKPAASGYSHLKLSTGNDLPSKTVMARKSQVMYCSELGLSRKWSGVPHGLKTGVGKSPTSTEYTVSNSGTSGAEKSCGLDKRCKLSEESSEDKENQFSSYVTNLQNLSAGNNALNMKGCRKDFSFKLNLNLLNDKLNSVKGELAVKRNNANISRLDKDRIHRFKELWEKRVSKENLSDNNVGTGFSIGNLPVNDTSEMAASEKQELEHNAKTSTTRLNTEIGLDIKPECKVERQSVNTLSAKTLELMSAVSDTEVSAGIKYEEKFTADERNALTKLVGATHDRNTEESFSIVPDKELQPKTVEVTHAKDRFVAGTEDVLTNPELKQHEFEKVDAKTEDESAPEVIGQNINKNEKNITFRKHVVKTAISTKEMETVNVGCDTEYMCKDIDEKNAGGESSSTLPMEMSRPLEKTDANMEIPIECSEEIQETGVKKDIMVDMAKEVGESHKRKSIEEAGGVVKKPRVTDKELVVEESTVHKVHRKTSTRTKRKPANSVMSALSSKFSVMDGKVISKNPAGQMICITKGSNSGEPLVDMRSPAVIKQEVLEFCQANTQGYKDVDIRNFSTSWNDGLSFCALIHHFLPDSFQFEDLNIKNQKHNFQLAFTLAKEHFDVYPLLDVEDMVQMKKPDARSVFTYVQSLYRKLKTHPRNKFSASKSP